MKKILLLYLTLILFSSCLYKNMYNFEEGDLDWMKPYAVGDTVRFETSTGTDYLCITKIEIYDSKSRFRQHEGEGDSFHANAIYTGFFLHNGRIRDFYMEIRKRSNGGLDFNNILLNERYCFGIKDERNMNEQGESIKDTIIIDDANSHYNHHYGPILDNCEYLKWSKHEGLIEYRLRDGTMYPYSH